MTPPRLFLLLVLLQTAHSIEEYSFGLYERLGPFKWLESQWPGVAPVAFAIVNIGFVSFGFWCYFTSVRRLRATAGLWITIWCLVEIGNGIGHPLWSLLAGQYVPGTVTAPFLLVVAVMLLWRWHRVRPAA